MNHDEIYVPVCVPVQEVTETAHVVRTEEKGGGPGKLTPGPTSLNGREPMRLSKKEFCWGTPVRDGGLALYFCLLYALFLCCSGRQVCNYIHTKEEREMSE